jgi:hypothetical protein
MSKSRGYTREQLDEFIRRHGTKWNNGEPPDKDLCHAAACALQDYLYFATDLRKEFGLAKKRGQRGRKIKPEQNGFIVNAVARWIVGAAGYTDTVNKIAELAQVDDRTAKAYMVATKPAAENLLKLLEATVLKQVENNH